MEYRKIIGIMLGAVIIIACIFVYINKDTFLQQQTVITHPDGCKEIYVDYKLITDKCSEPEQIRGPNTWNQININLSQR